MEANKILSASLLDLLFESRNKEYGAYELRTTYNKRITIALGIGGALVLALTLGTVFANSFSKKSNELIHHEVVIQQLPPEKEEPKIPEPEQKPPPEQVKSEKLTNIVIVQDDKVTEPPPSQDDLQNAKIDIIKQDGVPDVDLTPVDVVDDGKKLVEPQKMDEPEVWTKVEIDASFPGGMKKWIQFLERNCNGQVASDNGAPTGRYTVIVKFIVDENGNVSDIQPQTHLGYGMEEEAVKVLKKAASMKWTPAFQNKKYVKAYRSQPITFEVQGE